MSDQRVHPFSFGNCRMAGMIETVLNVGKTRCDIPMHDFYTVSNPIQALAGAAMELSHQGLEIIPEVKIPIAVSQDDAAFSSSLFQVPIARLEAARAVPLTGSIPTAA